MTDQATPLRYVNPRATVPARLSRLWSHRELLSQLIARDVKVRYKTSFLGMAWSLLNPAMYLGVYYLVFEIVLKQGAPDFTIYLLSGLLVWTFFSTSMNAAVVSISANANMVKKMSFPREILPLAAVGSALVTFALQSIVLVVALLVFRHGVAWNYLCLVLPGLLALALLAAALGLLTATINVFIRDLQHAVEFGMLAWFWFTPIVWYYGLVQDTYPKYVGWLLVNPVTSITLTFQRAIYARTEFRDAGGVHRVLPELGVVNYGLMVGSVLALGLVLFVFAEWVLERLEGNIAEEL